MKINQDKIFRYYLFMLFLNSFVDLGHKITIQNTVFKVYDGQLQIILIAVVNSLILLPFILLFTPSAYFSNRFALVKVMRISAWIALGCSLLITWFYYQGEYEGAFVMTLILAVQSAIYSPAKYGYIKQLMGEAKLVAANAKVQVATIVAILSGTLVFSILFELRLSQTGLTEKFTEPAILQSIAPLGWLLILSTILELFMAYRLVDIPIHHKQGAGFPWRDYFKGQTLKQQLSVITARPSVFYSIIGLSAFWGLSQMVLAAFPAYAKQHLLQSNTAVIQGLLACSGLGIFAGSILVSRLARRTYKKPLAEWQLRKQMIPFGALGVTLCLALVPFVSSLAALGLSFFGVGLFGAFFIVPLNAIIQSKTHADDVGTVLAGNNWVQNISMLSFLGLTIFSALLGVDSIWLLYLIAAISLIALIAYLRHGLRDLLQFVLGGLFRLRYDIQVNQETAFPDQGRAVLLLGNHVSWIDWALIQLATPRSIRFVIDRPFYEHWALHGLLKHVGTIPISMRRSKDALRQISGALSNGDVVCLFPEGQINRQHELNTFKAGYTLALRNTDALIVPFYIHGMPGSRFSRIQHGRSRFRDMALFRRRKIQVMLGAPSEHIDAEELQSRVTQLAVQAQQLD